MTLKEWLKFRSQNNNRLPNRKLPNGMYSMPTNTISRAICRALRRESGGEIIGWRINKDGMAYEIAAKRPRNFAYEYVSVPLHYKHMERIERAIYQFREGPFEAKTKFLQILAIHKLIKSAGGIELYWY